MDDMAPVPFEKKFTVYGYEDQDGGVDYTPNWTVTAYAIRSSPLSGLERRVSTSDTDSSDKSATVQCSSFNKILLSSSGKITGGLGEVGMEDINPLAFLGTSVMAREEDPDSPDWTTTAHAICADPGGLGLGAQVRVQSVRDSSPPTARPRDARWVRSWSASVVGSSTRPARRSWTTSGPARTSAR